MISVLFILHPLSYILFVISISDIRKHISYNRSHYFEILKMGKITVVVPDDLEAKLRKIAFDRLGGKRGGLSLIVTEALKLWLKEASS